MVNCPNTEVFAPDKPASRAEVVTALYQALRDRDSSRNSSLAAIDSTLIATT